MKKSSFGSILLTVLVLVVAFGAQGAYATYASPTPSGCNSCSNTNINTSTNSNSNDNEQKQEQKQEVNQTVTLETKEGAKITKRTETKGATESAKVAKQPQTGAGAWALSSIVGTGAFGVFLARFKKGKSGPNRKESLGEFANLVSIKKQDK